MKKNIFIALISTVLFYGCGSNATDTTVVENTPQSTPNTKDTDNIENNGITISRDESKIEIDTTSNDSSTIPDGIKIATDNNSSINILTNGAGSLDGILIEK